MVQGLFLAFLTMSLVGTVLGAVILLSGRVAYKRLGTVWYYTALVAVALVMLLPIRLEFESASRAVSVKDSEMTESVPESDTAMVSPSEAEAVTADGGLTLKKAVRSNSLLSFTSGKILGAVSAVWLCAALVLLAFRLTVFFVFWRRTVKNSREAVLSTVSEYFGRDIAVRAAKGVSSPFVFGLFHPVLMLPDRPLSEAQLDGILRHEALHVRRMDILVRWLLMILRCVHWYNPFAYYLAAKIEAECEVSCDFLATRGMTDGQRRNYAETLLSLLPASGGEGALTTAMSRGKRNIARRLVMLKNPVRTRSAFTALALAVTVALSLTALAVGGAVNGRLELSEKSVTYSENGALAAFIADADTTLIEVYTEKDGEYITSIPYTVIQAFPASDRSTWSEDDFGFLDGVYVYCGEIGDFRWAFVASGPVMSSSNLNLCTSHDGGRSWYVDNSARSIGKGIVEDAYFVSESEAYIIYSGGGYGRGFSKTIDGGKSWEHSMEYGFMLPLSKEDALVMLKNQLKIAYLNTYGEYTPRYDDLGEASGDRARLPYIIENLEITSDDGEYYTVPVIWDFLIEKQTGNIFKLYRGLNTMLIPFDPYESTALAFAG